MTFAFLSRRPFSSDSRNLAIQHGPEYLHHSPPNINQRNMGHFFRTLFFCVSVGRQTASYHHDFDLSGTMDQYVCEELLEHLLLHENKFKCHLVIMIISISVFLNPSSTLTRRRMTRWYKFQFANIAEVPVTYCMSVPSQKADIHWDDMLHQQMVSQLRDVGRGSGPIHHRPFRQHHNYSTSLRQEMEMWLSLEFSCTFTAST